MVALVKLARDGVNAVPAESAEAAVHPTVATTPHAKGRESEASGSGIGALTFVGETLVLALLLSDHEPAL